MHCHPYGQQFDVESCVLADSSFAFLKDLVASVPDVQGDEDQGMPCTSDGNSENQGTSEDSAGPSHSTADESETWSAEEDGEEDSETSSAESVTHQPVISSVPSTSIPSSSCNIGFAPSSSHHYMSYHVPYAPNNNTSNSVDDDYDS
ncbi:uncharacterized protein CEXT_333201 [Caerostris extrusa]|uniref:Uncharacterized protein n=1 Tax=Caerostris extrusa TaxID=172846 RepID=A0AAV4UBS9_CAEEX|nr:uncharacterized protein CEXT_333201 [Caerostris extrusa]